jgi:hypothetical protein
MLDKTTATGDKKIKLIYDEKAAGERAMAKAAATKKALLKVLKKEGSIRGK